MIFSILLYIAKCMMHRLVHSLVKFVVSMSMSLCISIFTLMVIYICACKTAQYN